MTCNFRSGKVESLGKWGDRGGLTDDLRGKLFFLENLNKTEKDFHSTRLF